MNLNQIQLASKIRKLRIEKNWSQKQMAERMKINPSSYYKIEIGGTDLSYSRIGQIAFIFGIDIVELLSK